MSNIDIKTDWDFLDCTHPDAMYLSWNKYSNTGSIIGGKKLSIEEQIHWCKLEIQKIKTELKFIRSNVVDNLGVKWANDNAKKMKSKKIKELVGKKKYLEEKLNNNGIFFKMRYKN